MTGSEEWKDIPISSDYQVSANGNVRSKKYGSWTIIKGGIDGSRYKEGFGYRFVFLYQDGIKIKRHVHRLVLEAFVGPCPEGMEACHNNGKSLDNRLENLRWDTRAANHKDKKIHGTDRHRGAEGVRNARAKLSESDVLNVIQSRLRGESQASIARQYGVCRVTIRRILNGSGWVGIQSKAGITHQIRERLNKYSETGFVGVTRRKGKYVATIAKGKKQRWLGTFTSLDAAVEARRMAEEISE